jgi:hypothetical protein
MDAKALRDMKRRAMHFNVDIRRPELVHRSAGGAPWRRPSLAEVLREKLETRPLSGDIDRAAFVALGLEYLANADAATAVTPVSENL